MKPSIVLFFLLLVASPAYSAGVAVVQSAAPTSNGGTQDFTSTGFGTPVCALFFVGRGTVNGTVVDHAMYGIGFSNFTNERTLAHADEDAQATTDTGADSSLTNALITLLDTTQAIDGTALATTITDGVRLTWADAPPSAYIVTAVMFNSSTVQNCTVGNITTNATQDATASVSGLGWQPDIVIAASRFATTTHSRTGVGIAINDSGVVQYGIGQNSQNGSVTSDLTQVIRNDRLPPAPVAAGISSAELTSFDSGGFTLTTRDASTSSAVLYLAMKLATGVRAKLIACNSPTSTGVASCTGTTWTPEAGIFLQTEATVINTYNTSDGNEAYGISAFTASQSSTTSIWSDDGQADSDTTSVTDSKVVRLRKNAADFLTATLSGFQSNGVDLNYTTVDASARLGAMLLFQSTGSSFGPLRRRGY